MRLVTWNMDHWRRPQEQRDAAWAFLRDEIRPDVALLQEAVPPDGVGSAVFRKGGMHDDRREKAKDLGWGSAVVAFGSEIRSIDSATPPFGKKPNPILRTFPGAVAVAELPGDKPIVVVSVYGVINRGYADATMHRILSDITPLVDERRGKRIIVAGDMNITTQWSAKHRSFLHGLHNECLRRDQTVFDRFKALGLTNVVEGTGPLDGCGCSAGDGCRHVQTQRHEKSTFPWQNDYIFLSEDLVESSYSVELITSEEAWTLSGHCPIVVELAGP